ncbi:MAG: hypothetical protein Q9P14_12020 [candidate division KSB1 bacterium]|nr:hypothetical protein [candidate division KSB1 bacterium]MDQ7064427.1 hypothetical protein [candidate division KSB1 bacterium]
MHALARIIAFALIVAVWGAGCAPSRLPLVRKAPPDTYLVRNGSFEQDTGWTRSAPVGFSEYAVLRFADRDARSGRRSAYVAIRRHPRVPQALHGWTQKIRPLPRGQTVRFGGWVKVSGQPQVRFGIEYERRRPVKGQTLFSVELPPVPADGRYHFVRQEVRLPDDTVELVLYLGISQIGAARFEDVFLKVMD